MMIKPARLKIGNTIGVLSPASPVNSKKLKKGVLKLNKLEYKVVLDKNVLAKRGFLAGEDKIRAKALNKMFANPKINAILCSRGGYGTLRLLNLLDYNKIKKNPKILMGFSDITALHLAINKKCNLVTFHGPMVAGDFSKLSSYNKNYFLKAVSQTEPIGKIQNSKRIGNWKVITPGKASEKILGGNLTLICRLMGTDYEPDFKDKILFLEDINSEPYQIDSLLAQLQLAGVLDKVKGVVIGEFFNFGPRKKEDSSSRQIFEDYFKDRPYPVIYPVSCGHGKDKITIPLGVKVTIDTYKKIFSIDEAGVQ
ncbi:MAG TPA: LD-carboxypeptidase [candidate division Zixibacteria bacterium]|nr:LD-carboxypeptidase [candidate division Zixibacteria bacterium]